MNYYERHIGDYLKDTAHLSLLEHGIYSRLMDVYYTRERGIGESEAARIIGARSEDEREALQAVLDEFFQLVDGVYIQSRCDAEIERYKSKQAKAAASANARWKKPTAKRTECERNTDAMRTHSEGNAHQSPDTSNQTPGKEKTAHSADAESAVVAKTTEPKSKRYSYRPPDWVPAGPWSAFVDSRRKSRHPLTERAAALIVNELAKLSAKGQDPGDVLDQSTRNGWRDVFPLRTPRRAEESLADRCKRVADDFAGAGNA